MNNGEPSQTALTAAAARAAHLIVDSEPLIFRDTLAYPLLGDRAEELIDYHRLHGEHLVLAAARTQVTTRSRYTEDRLAAAVPAGITQYVILGAGLDSFAHRSSLAGQVRVFEVDHPATQRWKRDRLAGARIEIPPTLAHVPVDLEAESPLGALIRSGFDRTRPALISWLGVTMYLTRAAIEETLAMVAGLAPGTEIVIDYMLPERLRDAAGQTYVDMVMPDAAGRGDPWLTFLGPDDMAALLAAAGLEVVEHVRQCDAIAAALWNRSDPLRPAELSVLTRARLP